MALGAAITVEVKGLDVLERGLLALPEAVAGKALSQALFAGAGVIRKEAQLRIPVGSVPHYIGRKAKGKLVQPGNLRKQLRTRRIRDGKFSQMLGVTFSGDGFYGMFQEFGTARHKAQPFLRPAFDAKKDEALQRIRDRLAANIERQSRKIYEESLRASR